MSRITPHKDPLASFIWTAGAADMVIGGVGERGSLFTLGLLTVGAGLLVRWLRQQRSGQAGGANERFSASHFAGRHFAGGYSTANSIAAVGEGLVKLARRGPVAAVAQFGTGSTRQSHPRSRVGSPYSSVSQSRRPAQPPLAQPSRGYSAAARPGLRANRFVRQSAELLDRQSSSARHPAKPVSKPPPARPSRERPVQSAQNSPQGPPLNLPPAPQPRTRRERRVY